MMFNRSGDTVKINVWKSNSDGEWKYRISNSGHSGPAIYLGSVKTEVLTGDAFLDGREVIVINTMGKVSEIKNSILVNRKNDDSEEFEAIVIGNLDLTHIYEQVKEGIMVQAAKEAHHIVNLKVNYKKLYEEEKAKVKKYESMYVKIQNVAKQILEVK